MSRGSQGITGMPWRGLNAEDAIGVGIDSTDILGGDVVRYIAAATLNIGDVVFISATRTVDKTPTSSTNHYKVAGVVVGGRAFGNEIPHDAASVGKVAATVGQEVYVCYKGVAYVVADAAIAAGVPIAPSTTTAGRVRPAIASVGGAISGAPGIGTLAIAAGATPVTSTAANGAIITGAPTAGTLAVAAQTGDGLSAVFGKLIEAASAAGNVRAALINV